MEYNIKFSKYQGLGNDFIITTYDILSKVIPDNEFKDFSIKVCDRRLGVGADGMMIVRTNPLRMEFYNADGSIGTMCGNGLRCFIYYCYNNYIVSNDKLGISTLAGIMKSERIEKNKFRINMGKPIFDTQFIGMKTDKKIFLKEKLHGLEVNVLFMGTIHMVVFVQSIEEIMKTDIGMNLCNDKIFLDRCNINFVEIIDESNFKVQTYERGVGWTLACGTGACASYVIGKLENKCHEYVNIHFPYGVIKIDEKDNDIYMTGPTEKVCDGEFLYIK